MVQLHWGEGKVRSIRGGERGEGREVVERVVLEGGSGEGEFREEGVRGKGTSGN
jgi:hypothetical protein